MRRFISLVSFKRHIRATSAEMQRIQCDMKQACEGIEAALASDNLADSEKARMREQVGEARATYVRAIEDAARHLDYFEYVMAQQTPLRRMLLAIIPA